MMQLCLQRQLFEGLVREHLATAVYHPRQSTYILTTTAEPRCRSLVSISVISRGRPPGCVNRTCCLWQAIQAWRCSNLLTTLSSVETNV